MSKTLVWLETRHDQFAVAALEALGKARELTPESGLQAVIIGDDEAIKLAQDAIHLGADEVFCASDPRLSLYQSNAYSKIFSQIARAISPEIIIVGGSSLGMELAPAVAAELRTGLTAHCVHLAIEEINGRPVLKQSVPGWGGNMLVTIICLEAKPQMATICKGVFAAARRDLGRTGKITRWKVELSGYDFRVHTIAVEREKTENSLAKAGIVVAGGFGMLSAGGWELIEELAKALGAAVGGTRAAADHGWITEEQMIGQSGVSIAPKILIVAGASGATHFTTGFRGAQTVIAIDKNPIAPIFSNADLGIVGDAGQIISALIKEISNHS